MPKAEALTETGAGYIARMRQAISASASIIGDKRVSEYSPLDMQKYAATLGLLPNNWSQDSGFGSPLGAAVHHAVRGP